MTIKVENSNFISATFDYIILNRKKYVQMKDHLTIKIFTKP